MDEKRDILAYSQVKLHTLLDHFLKTLNLEENYTTTLAAYPDGYSFHISKDAEKDKLLKYPVVVEILYDKEGKLDKEAMFAVLKKELAAMEESFTNAFNSY